MKIHEYQAKQILAKYGVPVPRGSVAYSVDEATKVAEDLGTEVCVVKAQIHAGGRGKGGGVKVSKGMDAVRENAEAILGMQLVTHQTGPQGQKVKQLLVEEGMDISKELYCSVLVDRGKQRIVLLASTEGGMDIEEVAEITPEKILKVFVDPAVGLRSYQTNELAFGLKIDKINPKLIRPAAAVFKALYQAFVQEDCSLVEINPLVLTGDGLVVALDAKLSFDDNAMFRHKDNLAFRDKDEEDPLEVEASDADLNYIKLDGSIGCMVNGAGLAMATMDIIKLYGEEPANFLDVGGGASKEKVAAAFKIILSDKSVKGILINIFGGIMRCDVLAQGVVDAAKESKISVPLVVRLAGTNFQEGKKILSNSDLKIISANNLGDAAKKIVEAIK